MVKHETEGVEQKKEGLINTALIALLISGLIFIACPTFIVSSNLADINAFPLMSSAKVSLVGFVAGFLGFFALLQVKLLRPLFFGLLIYVALAALILPVTSSSAMIDPAEQPASVINLILCLVIAICFGILAIKFDVVQRLALTLISFVTVFTLAHSLFSISQAVSPNIENQSTFSTLSSNRNIIVMSFDGVPGEMITRILNDDPAFKSTLKDFSYFPNTYSQSPATAASMFGEIYGVHDYKKISNTLEGLRKKIQKRPAYKNSYLNKVKDFEHLYAKIPGQPSARPNFKTADQHSNLFLIQNSFSRIFTKFFFKTGIPSVLESLFLDKESDSKIGSEAEHNGEKWDFKNVKKIEEYDDFVSSLIVKDESRLTVRYYHNTFPHFPIDFDQECVHRSVDKEWFESNQTEEALQNQSRCVVKKIGALVDKLKQIGAYENSTIVLKSDHGEPFYYFDNPPNNLTFNNDTRFGYNRYRPFLMIKKPNTIQSELEFDDRFVLLNDLAKTLCKASKVKEINCNVHKGINLFSKEKGLDQPYFLYILKNKRATFRYETHISVKVPNRRVDVLEFLEQHDLVDISEPKRKK